MIIWTATIGHTDLNRDALPGGSASPMSRAIEKAFCDITGRWPNITFSGWGKHYLDEAHLAVVEKRDVRADPRHLAAWDEARLLVETVIGDEADFDDERTNDAVCALCELIWSRRDVAAAPPTEEEAP